MARSIIRKPSLKKSLKARSPVTKAKRECSTKKYTELLKRKLVIKFTIKLLLVFLIYLNKIYAD